MMRGLAILMIGGLLATGLSSTAFGQWQPVDIHNLDDSLQANHKKVVVLVTAEWCHYCAMQKKRIEQDKQLQKLLSDVYFVEMDVATRGRIHFCGEEYRHVPNGPMGGMHELAIALAGCPMSLPTWVFLDGNGNSRCVYPGLLPTKRVKAYLRSFLAL